MNLVAKFQKEGLKEVRYNLSLYPTITCSTFEWNRKSKTKIQIKKEKWDIYENFTHLFLSAGFWLILERDIRLVEERERIHTCRCYGMTFCSGIFNIWSKRSFCNPSNKPNYLLDWSFDDWEKSWKLYWGFCYKREQILLRSM